jgi:hypothetical protein
MPAMMIGAARVAGAKFPVAEDRAVGRDIQSVLGGDEL